MDITLSFQNVSPEGRGDVRYFPVIGATYGFKRGEIGAGFVHERCDCGPTGTVGPLKARYNFGVAHAKYRLMGNPNRASLAVGFHHLNFHTEGGYVNTGYLTGSLPLMRSGDSPKLRANLGVLYQQIRLAGDNDDNVTRPAFGLEFLPARQFSLVADYIPKSGVAERVMSLSARYQGDHLGGAIGVGRLRDEDSTIFGSVTYRFGVDDDDDDHQQH